MNANVLIVEDDFALREALTTSLKINGIDTLSADSAESALSLLDENHLPDMIITDMQMGQMSGLDLLKNVRQKSYDLPVIMMTAYGDVSNAVEAMRFGASDYLQKPFEASRLTRIVENYLPKNQVSEVIVEDPASQSLYRYAKKIASTDSNVLLSGPSGAGKEVMAKYIHQASTRVDEPFIAINCAAIPENMLEATLFGYEKGAFTGAHQACPGKFEQAQKGTLLLDEISEMELSLQAKLLRVLQEKEVERLGGKKSIQLDVRVIATTNRDLKKEVSEKRFREDLFYRLNVFPIRCLSLKERPKDIVALASYLLNKNPFVKSRGGLEISAEAKAKLVGYPWPGNVRELDNLMQRIAVLAEGNIVSVEDIQFENDGAFYSSSQPNERAAENENTLVDSVQHHEFQLIIEALEKFSNKKKDVAEALKISPRTLRYKLARMRELGYEIPRKGAQQ